MSNITLTRTFTSTCFGCDGATVWLSAGFTIGGQFIRLYCPTCGADVHPAPSKQTLRELAAMFRRAMEAREAEAKR